MIDLPPDFRKIAAEDIVVEACFGDRAGGDELRHVCGRHQMVFDIGMPENGVGKQQQNLTNGHVQPVVVAEFQQRAQPNATRGSCSNS